ncbi:hypothetical protein HP437_11615 [Serratia marcescens]|uniref:hypothetical protein n=1 Tax=Serratia marcescens TaxID=615 RepID=UPI0015D94C33|nr:hypothetical protein [Serratia marcescens]QLJ65788.1 hypothetical protein HP437_11615 [Serratia marcescens]
MTLATETIKLWRNNAKITAGETAEDDPEHIAAKAILALTAELLANREAQPDDKPFGYYSKETAAILERRGFAPISANPLVDHSIPLYTTPPAPAVPEVDFDEWFKREFHPDKTGPYVKNQMRFCWDACRAAMLAQPVSSGYTFNSPVIPDGWKLVPIDATRAMIEAAQRVEEDGYDAMHKAMLAAAPEGGNDHDTRR